MHQNSRDIRYIGSRSKLFDRWRTLVSRYVRAGESEKKKERKEKNITRGEVTRGEKGERKGRGRERKTERDKRKGEKGRNLEPPGNHPPADRCTSASSRNRSSLPPNPWYVAHAHPGIEPVEAQRHRRTSRRVRQCVWRTVRERTCSLWPLGERLSSKYKHGETRKTTWSDERARDERIFPVGRLVGGVAASRGRVMQKVVRFVAHVSSWSTIRQEKAGEIARPRQKTLPP